MQVHVPAAVGLLPRRAETWLAPPHPPPRHKPTTEPPSDPDQLDMVDRSNRRSWVRDGNFDPTIAVLLYDHVAKLN
jgi:hypothetical protein